MTTPSDEQAAREYAYKGPRKPTAIEGVIDAFEAGIRYRDAHPRTPEPSGDDSMMSDEEGARYWRKQAESHLPESPEPSGDEADWAVAKEHAYGVRYIPEDSRSEFDDERMHSFLAGRQSLRSELDRVKAQLARADDCLAKLEGDAQLWNSYFPSIGMVTGDFIGCARRDIAKLKGVGA